MIKILCIGGPLNGEIIEAEIGLPYTWNQKKFIPPTMMDLIGEGKSPVAEWDRFFYDYKSFTIPDVCHVPCLVLSGLQASSASILSMLIRPEIMALNLDDMHSL